MAYARSLQAAEEAGLGGMFGQPTSGDLAIRASDIIGWIIVLGLYALVFALINRGSGAGRITGIIFAVLGSLGALGSFISAFSYGWVAILVVLVALAFIAVNIMWIIQAVKAKPAAR